MYTLRTVESNQKQTNEFIGSFYQFIERDSSYEAFCSTFKNVFQRDHVADLCETADQYTKNVYGFIVTNNGTNPLYKDNSYYIMTENGKTFSNLTYK